MLSEIYHNLERCDWDLLDHVYKDDPMAHCFPVWQRIYRLKWAIAAAIMPMSILEIGVRYGYSAFAFLAPAPGAHYLGLDNDGDVSGGVAGSLKWAASQLRKYEKASVLKTDTQKLQRLPGDVWDLIHVDGQQDGRSTDHDLSLAVEQARYILIDGYWWSEENYKSISNWLSVNRVKIEWYAVMNDAASQYGDVLIKVRR